MDLLSCAIRTIFYDVNIKYIVDKWKKGPTSFVKEGFTDQTVWHTDAFTRTEIKELNTYIFDELKTRAGYTNNFPWHSLLYLLTLFSEKCLKLSNGIPAIEDGKHLQWRSLSLLIGEDILTTSYKAYSERKQNPGNLNFSWPNVIDTSSDELKYVFDNGLSDTHAHLLASAEIFELTWLDFMNYIVNRNDNYRGLFKLAESVTLTETGEGTYSIDVILQIAAALRFNIVQSLRENKMCGELKAVVSYFENDYARTQYLTTLQASIDAASLKGKRVYVEGKDFPLDYCDYQGGDSIYALHDGERRWLYRFFRLYFRKDNLARNLADYVFLYLQLKIRVRREFIQTNSLIGFENFKTYQDRKNSYCCKYEELYPVYAVQSSIRQDKDDTLEARVAPINIPGRDLSLSLFNNTVKYSNINSDTLTFVVHMLKSSGEKCKPEYKGSRFGYREEYHSQIDAIIEDAGKRLDSNPQRPIYNIVGIDAAGSELICSSAVFGHVYRYAKARGMVNLTYHVGEDFFDLTDGLLSIYEAITFQELGKGCRLGHASALGVDTSTYYSKRSYQAIMTKQRLLDCLAVMLYYSQGKHLDVERHTTLTLYRDAERLYSEIGYKTPYRTSVYVSSMYLRSDELSEEGVAPWSSTSLCSDAYACKARTIKRVKDLNLDYQTNTDIIEKGKQKELYTFQKDIVKIVSNVQIALMEYIKGKEIVIESNPTSNLHIGPFDSYENLPLFAFAKHGVRFSVNTDDKGVFATSLSNELFLVAEAKGIDKKSLIQKICEENKKSRFLAKDIQLIKPPR